MDQRFKRKEINVGENKMINKCMPNIYVEINVGANEMVNIYLDNGIYIDCLTKPPVQGVTV